MLSVRRISRFSLVLSVVLACAYAPAAQSQSVSAKAIVEVGGEGDAGTTLDRPQAAFLVAASGILIAEERSAPFLKLLDSRGRKRQLLGRMGAGPGEYRNLSAAAYDSGSRQLAVFDPALRRVTFYSVGDSLTMTMSKDLQLHVTAACYVGSDLWVHGDNGSGGVMHRLEIKGGQLVVGFSTGSTSIKHPLDGNRRFQDQVVQGPMACDAKGRRVAVASRALGVVQVFDIAGGKLSTTRLKGFIPLEFVALERGGLRLQRGKSGETDEIAAVRFRGAELSAIVGHMVGANQGFGDYSRIQEHSVTTQLPVGTQQKTVEVDAAHGRVLCYSVGPFPTFQVVTATRCP